MKFLSTVLLICVGIAAAFAAPQPFLKEFTKNIPFVGGMVSSLPVDEFVSSVPVVGGVAGGVLQ